MPTISVNKRTLLLTTKAPSNAQTGGIVLNQLAHMFPVGSLACVVVPDRVKYPRHDNSLNQMPIKYFLRLNEYPRTFVPTAVSKFIDRQYMNGLTNRIVAFAREQKVQAVWCILESLTQIYLARAVADRLGVPLFTQVWDPPSWWLHVRRVRRDYAEQTLAEFDQAIRHSAACAVTSWAMAEAYHNKYGAKTTILLPSLPKELALPPATSLHDPVSLSIGLAGQIYAYDTWDSLIKALDSVNWTIGQRQVNIHLFGRHDKVKPLNHPHIIKSGWASQTETIRSLSNMDILYCPYWFDPKYTEETTISFPSKLITYYAAGRPVFFHGPITSGPAKFIKNNNAGYVCTSPEPKQIIRGLTEIVDRPDLYLNFSLAGSKAFNEYFTIDCLAAALQEFISA